MWILRWAADTNIFWHRGHGANPLLGPVTEVGYLKMYTLFLISLGFPYRILWMKFKEHFVNGNRNADFTNLGESEMGKSGIQAAQFWDSMKTLIPAHKCFTFTLLSQFSCFKISENVRRCDIKVSTKVTPSPDQCTNFITIFSVTKKQQENILKLIREICTNGLHLSWSCIKLHSIGHAELF